MLLQTFFAHAFCLVSGLFTSLQQPVHPLSVENWAPVAIIYSLSSLKAVVAAGLDALTLQTVWRVVLPTVGVSRLRVSPDYNSHFGVA